VLTIGQIAPLALRSAWYCLTAGLCAFGQGWPVTALAATAAQSEAGARLMRLLHESDEAQLRRNPFNALGRGDLRYADRLGYDVSNEYFAAEKKADESDLRRLRQIDRRVLPLTEQIEYDAFEWNKEIELKGLEPRYLNLIKVLPIESFTGFHLDYADIASGNGVAPFNTLTDYENNLKRHAQYALFIDRVIVRLKEGLATGVVQPRSLVEKMIDQLNVQVADGGVAIFDAPLRAFPDSLGPLQRQQLRGAYTTSTRETIVPALRRLHDFLQREYLPHARNSIGLGQVSGGATLYAYLIELNTTLPLTADDIHRMGLAEVARIERDMRHLQEQLGFKGALREFFERVRADPALRAGSPADIQKDFENIRRRVMAHVNEQFTAPPLDRFEIRPEPAYKETPGNSRRTGASGYYQGGTLDGTRPGIFYYVVGTTPEMDTVFLHEVIPGHHLQNSVAEHNQSLPAFLRYDGPLAYLEGWALYAETLWREFGLERDLYRRFGGLNAEMTRAVRLVVDTGIHAKGWTREQAVAFILDHSSAGRAEAESAVDRYIAVPGQALAYKVGELAILDLKTRAQRKLGDSFDPRAFHDQILSSGALPLGVLKYKVNAWLAGARRVD
jgi:uncharacterized protein (DUF885 family)